MLTVTKQFNITLLPRQQGEDASQRYQITQSHVESEVMFHVRPSGPVAHKEAGNGQILPAHWTVECPLGVMFRGDGVFRDWLDPLTSADDHLYGRSTFPADGFRLLGSRIKHGTERKRAAPSWEQMVWVTFVATHWNKTTRCRTILSVSLAVETFLLTALMFRYTRFFFFFFFFVSCQFMTILKSVISVLTGADGLFFIRFMEVETTSSPCYDLMTLWLPTFWKGIIKQFIKNYPCSISVSNKGVALCHWDSSCPIKRKRCFIRGSEIVFFSDS